MICWIIKLNMWTLLVHVKICGDKLCKFSLPQYKMAVLLPLISKDPVGSGRHFFHRSWRFCKRKPQPFPKQLAFCVEECGGKQVPEIKNHECFYLNTDGSNIQSSSNIRILLLLVIILFYSLVYTHVVDIHVDILTKTNITKHKRTYLYTL